MISHIACDEEIETNTILEPETVKMGFKSEFSTLEPTLRTRIKRVGVIAGVWTTFIFGSAAVFYFSKPYLDKKRKDREAALLMAKTENGDEEILRA